MKRVIAIVLSLCAFAALCLYFYSVRQVNVFGRNFTLDEKELSFNGSEIDGVDNLIRDLKQFKNLEKVDLGTFMVHADEKDKLDKALPDTDLIYDTYINVYGDRIKTDTTTLDVSNKDISDLTDIKRAIPYLKNLKNVVCTTSTVSHDVKEELIKEFPSVTFDIASTFNIYGLTVRDDVKTLDLKGVTPDEHLVSYLKLFPDLTDVDLHGSEITPEFQLSLAKQFPDIAFGWEVEVDGTKFDSLIEDLDLTDHYRLTTDAVRQILPLFPKLKRLDMSNCAATNEEMAALRAEYPDINVVWLLRMGRWSLKTDAIAFSVLIYDYSHKRLTSDDIQVLQYCTQLQALDIGHQAVTDLSVIGDYLPELRILILADNQVSDLTPLSKLKHLHYLEFFVNWQIKDLTPLAECKELVDLNISHNGLISDITPLLDLPLLERLWIEHTGVSNEDIQKLRERYPDAQIVDQGYGSVDQGWRTHPRYYAMIKMYHENYMDELFSMYDNK